MHSIKSIAIAAIGIAFSALVSIAQAAPVTVPVGLNPGDQYRLVFVTSTTRDATSANLADYNAFVTAAANSVSELAALGANWRAIASTAGNPNARTNTNTDFAVDGAGVKIFLLDGTTIVADDNQDLWDGTLDNAINRDESGAVLAGSGFPDAGVWTGTSFTGVVSPGGRGLGGIPNGPMVGDHNSTSTTWMQFTPSGINTQHHLYGISDVITVEVISEPAALAVFGLGLAAIGLMRRRRAA